MILLLNYFISRPSGIFLFANGYLAKYIERKVHINSDQNNYLFILRTQKRTFIYGLTV